MCSLPNLIELAGPGFAATRWMAGMECISAGVVRVDGEWGRVVSVGRERSCSGPSRMVVSVEKSVIYSNLPLCSYCRIRSFQPTRLLAFMLHGG